MITVSYNGDRSAEPRGFLPKVSEKVHTFKECNKVAEDDIDFTKWRIPPHNSEINFGKYVDYLIVNLLITRK